MAKSDFPIVQIRLNDIPERMFLTRKDLTKEYGIHQSKKIMQRLNTGRLIYGLVFKSVK